MNSCSWSSKKTSDTFTCATATKYNIPELLKIPENSVQYNSSRGSLIYRLSNIYAKDTNSTLYRFFSGEKNKQPDIFIHVVYPSNLPPALVDTYILDMVRTMKEDNYYKTYQLPIDIPSTTITRVSTARNSVKKYHKVFNHNIYTVAKLTSLYETHYGAKLQPNVYTFYLGKYFDHLGDGTNILNKLTFFLSSIARANSYYDNEIYLQTSAEPYKSYKSALNAQPTLLTPSDRKWSRKKVIASLSQVFTYGAGQFSCIIISQPVVQMNLKYLDASLFLSSTSPFSWTKQDAGLFAHLYRQGEQEEPWTPQKNNNVLLSNAYYRNCLEDWSLLLSAFNEMIPKVSATKKGWLRIPPLVREAYANSPDGKSLRSIMQPILLKALEDLLQAVTFPNIQGVELVGDDTWIITKTIQNYIVSSPGKIVANILDIATILQENFVVGVVNPSTSFALPGNKIDTGMESDIGDKTSIRFDQVYFMNPVMLDPNHFFRIELPI